ncbi:Ser-Thr-rich glycosyl-phosphatidyl-inositol-anchored membrane family-domain-containing protein [Massariosphaeria phaeospora]|uniref:Ser-Thr-rich glycosyl-phosphatidyl-inositol-anchored membrane family-domain-containing protein n=1 Tax=Massariosphaeria phaeospora TaxID=100035 RepID=A0A7C8MJF3_9PLEO|nr:Ser-Thr-rich glycosyl-phosphatidyl-inositol-anchored membrane family-domain-containing protein [Massariosphaeria phaeospora]
MRFFEVILSGSALIAAAWALELNDWPNKFVSGETYTITYSPKDDTPTQLKLRQGESDNLKDVAVLTTDATGGSFTFTVDESLPNGDDYAIEVSQGTTVNYSNLIPLTGSEASPIASSATPSATASSSASASESASSKSASLSSASESSMSMTSSAASASATLAPSSSLNATITTGTLSRTASPSSTDEATGTSSGGPPESTGAASLLSSSPLALIFGAVAAMAYLN